MYRAFTPGQKWLDTEGKPIQAHGGSILTVDGVFYWYGENKEKTDGKNGIWHWGVRCYASQDLYNWEDKGLIIPPDPDHPGSPLHPSSKMDRPHILYNPKTGKYVCWVKLMEPNGQQTATVLTADHILGPYTMVRTGLKPLGMSAGDFDLVSAPDGKAYYYFERVHSETICADLTEDYTDVTGYYSTHFPHHEGPPFVREATAHFFRQGKHYLVTSGTTGYKPNPSEIAVADTWHGPYRVLGNPHPDDPTDTSFHSQISSVFHVPGTDLYIALADRWIPDHMDWDYHEYKKQYQKHFDPTFTGEVHDPGWLGDVEINTSQARYVWLPISFEGEIPVIRWLDSWRWQKFIGLGLERQ